MSRTERRAGRSVPLQCAVIAAAVTFRPAKLLIHSSRSLFHRTRTERNGRGKGGERGRGEEQPRFMKLSPAGGDPELEPGSFQAVMCVRSRACTPWPLAFCFLLYLQDVRSGDEMCMFSVRADSRLSNCVTSAFQHGSAGRGFSSGPCLFSFASRRSRGFALLGLAFHRMSGIVKAGVFSPTPAA